MGPPVSATSMQGVSGRMALTIVPAQDVRQPWSKDGVLHMSVPGGKKVSHRVLCFSYTEWDESMMLGELNRCGQYVNRCPSAFVF